MKAEELRKLNKTDLQKKLFDFRKKQRDLRFSKARGELKNPLEKQHVKKDIARILTILRENSRSAGSRDNNINKMEAGKE